MEAVGTRKVNTNGKRNNKPWFTKEARTLTKEKKEAYIKYRNQTLQQEYNRYKEIRNRVSNRINELKKEY